MTDLYRDPDLDQLVESLNRERLAASDLPEDDEEIGAESLSGAAAEPLPSTSEAPAATPVRPPGRPDAAPAAPAPPAAPLAAWLERLVASGGSDLLLVAGAVPTLRVHGRLEPSGELPLAAGAVEALFATQLDARRHELLAAAGAVDFSLRLPSGGGRFRVNLHRQRGGLAAAVRALPQRIPTLAELNLPTLARRARRPAPRSGSLLRPHRRRQIDAPSPPCSARSTARAPATW